MPKLPFLFAPNLVPLLVASACGNGLTLTRAQAISAAEHEFETQVHPDWGLDADCFKADFVEGANVWRVSCSIRFRRVGTAENVYVPCSRAIVFEDGAVATLGDC